MKNKENFKKNIDKTVEFIMSCWDENNPDDGLTFDERIAERRAEIGEDAQWILDDAIEFNSEENENFSSENENFSNENFGNSKNENENFSNENFGNSENENLNAVIKTNVFKKRRGVASMCPREVQHTLNLQGKMKVYWYMDVSVGKVIVNSVPFEDETYTFKSTAIRSGSGCMFGIPHQIKQFLKLEVGDKLLWEVYDDVVMVHKLEGEVSTVYNEPSKIIGTGVTTIPQTIRGYLDVEAGDIIAWMFDMETGECRVEKVR